MLQSLAGVLNSCGALISDWLCETGSCQVAQWDVRGQRPYKSCWQTDAAAEDDEETQGGRTQGAHLLSGDHLDSSPIYRKHSR